MKPTDIESLVAHIQVKNLRTDIQDFNRDSRFEVYCGRGKRSGMINAQLGNPFEIPKHGTRAEVCNAFERVAKGIKEDWRSSFTDKLNEEHHRISNQVAMLAALCASEPDRQMNLWCYCAPLRCHATTIKELLIKELCKLWGINAPDSQGGPGL